MRLTCPNCALRYEVADGIIAPGGQHVQCTACHTRWFERPPERPLVALIGEDEIIARLEARSDRVLGRTDASAQNEDNDTEAAASEGPSLQTGQTFAWEGQGLPEPTEEFRHSGSHLRLVEFDLEPEPEEESAAPEPAVDASSSEREERKVALIKAATNDVPERPSRRRLDLEAAVHSSDEEHPAPERRTRSAIIAIGLVLLALFAAAYLAAEDLAQAVPALAPSLGVYMGAIDDARLAIETSLDPASGMDTVPEDAE